MPSQQHEQGISSFIASWLSKKKKAASLKAALLSAESAGLRWLTASLSLMLSPLHSRPRVWARPGSCAIRWPT